MPTDLTLAFAGHAPNRKANIESLLEDWLHLASPDKDGYYDKPSRWGEITLYGILTDGQVPKGLQPALHMALSIGDLDAGVRVILITDKITGDVQRWAEAVDEVQEVDDPLSHLVSQLANGPRPHLFINWDEKDADDSELIRQAHEHANIKVSDLAQGLVQILPGEDEAEAEPEAPVEEEPEPPRRKSSRRRDQELEEQEEELEDQAPPAQEPQEEPQASEPSTLEEEVAAAKHQQDMQSAIAVGTVTVASEALREILHQVGRASFYLQAQDTAQATLQLADVGWSPLTVDLMAAEEALANLLEQGEPYNAVVEATQKSAPKKPGSKDRRKVVWDDDANEWKPAGRGRTRRGVRVGWMDADGNVTEES